MKKKMFMMLCLAILGIQVSKAQQSIIALHHEGNVTIFAGSKTQEAMDASVKGDTLYLSEGTFAGWNVTHGIVVLGSGERTVVSGNITITGNDDKKDLGGYVFSGINLIHDFVVNDSVNGLRISQCQMNNFTVNEGKHLETGEMVMSYVKGTMLLQSSILGLEVLNSKLSQVKYGGNKLGAVNFIHCNVATEAGIGRGSDGEYVAHKNTHNNTYLNSIVGIVIYSSFINCIYRQKGYSNVDYSNIPNSKQVDFTFDDNLNCSLSDDSLRAAGYLGDDGTVVGITGGECPFTLELATPHIVDHKVDVDNVNRKLTVTLKMAHEATKEDE